MWLKLFRGAAAAGEDGSLERVYLNHDRLGDEDVVAIAACLGLHSGSGERRGGGQSGKARETCSYDDDDDDDDDGDLMLEVGGEYDDCAIGGGDDKEGRDEHESCGDEAAEVERRAALLGLPPRLSPGQRSGRAGAQAVSSVAAAMHFGAMPLPALPLGTGPPRLLVCRCPLL